MAIATRARVHSRAGALRPADVGVLVAVGIVVLVVSLPRLRDLALRENESDARSLVERLGRLCAREANAAAPQDVRALIAGDGALVRQLDDVEYLDSGRLLRRHGYLFELLDEASARDSGALVRAWPWQHLHTGQAAFAWTPAQELLGSPNEDGAFSGLEARPTLGAQGANWRPLAAD